MADWNARFAALKARKTVEALTATIAPFATDRDDADASLAAIGNAWTRRLFDGPFYLSPSTADLVPATNLIFVRSRDGNTVAKNPQTLGGGEADKHLIYEGLSRVAADAVLGGHATIRDGDLVLSVWHPELVTLRMDLGLPRHPTQIVATLRGLDLDDGLMFNLPELNVIVLTVPHGAALMRDRLAARPWITPVVMRDPSDLPHAFRQLTALGIRRLSCIGGRTLAGELLDAGLIQDLYLTTSAVSAGEPDTPFYDKPLATHPVVRKRGTGADAGVVFEHVTLSDPTRAKRATQPTQPI
jgi:riboflavin biosynthesis pyrimidine reductase